jgi:hypothetical protein
MSTYAAYALTVLYGWVDGGEPVYDNVALDCLDRVLRSHLPSHSLHFFLSLLHIFLTHPHLFISDSSISTRRGYQSRRSRHLFALHVSCSKAPDNTIRPLLLINDSTLTTSEHAWIDTPTSDYGRPGICREQRLAPALGFIRVRRLPLCATGARFAIAEAHAARAALDEPAGRDRPAGLV